MRDRLLLDYSFRFLLCIAIACKDIVCRIIRGIEVKGEDRIIPVKD